MSLSCHCDGDGEWWYFPPDDYTTLDTKRSRKCTSCRERIPVGALTLRFQCERLPNNEIEERIYGDEVPLAPRFMCERCGDLYLSLDELGYCYMMGEDVRELVREYAELHKRAA